ncbi:MAG: DNA polymerase III subunit alpha [Calditrichaeota bacterium]|nr:DNA polymerase III subunit alpha [Calditrichota bacterium]
MLNEADIVPLHVQTPFSFYEGAGTIRELAEVGASAGHRALAFTDRNRVSGLVQADKAARAQELKPVLGAVLDEPGDPGRALLLWAETTAGYGEICRLVSERQLDPEFTLAGAARALAPGVIAATDQPDLLEILRGELAPGALFANLVAFTDPAGRNSARRAWDAGRRLALPFVATVPVTHARPEQRETVRLLRAIGGRTVLSRQPDAALGHALSDVPALLRCFDGVPEALVNTRAIAERCAVDLKLGELKFPAPQLPDGADPFSELRRRAEEGSRRRYGPAPPPAARERLAYELGVIDHLGFTGYMLVVHDIARRAWAKGVRTLGRGSAANSIVCYCLGLTDICPLKYDLYFERFLNSERSSPPDVDLDFSWRDRDEILAGVYDSYGDDHVAMIATYVTFGARGALHETALARGLPEEEIGRVTRHVPHFSHPSSLAALKDEVPACRDLPLDRQPWKGIAQAAQAILSLPRHLSIHAGGVVITPSPITDWTALERASKGFVITQYDMYSVEDLGLVKIDLLSQRSLGVMKDACRMVEENGRARPPVDDVERVFTDPATRTLLRSGRTMGAFYVESPGMIALLQKLKCDNFEGLIAASSVIRPGVSESGMMQQYIECVNDPAQAEYLHAKMRALLSETHGVMIYQEDVIKVAHHVAGLSLGRADLLRRAMSGKGRSREAMKALRDEFLRGCRERDVKPAVAREIWRQIESFAGYSFCKAHSASFAVLSMQVAYLKAHHPAEFYAAVLANGGGYYSQAAYVSDAKRNGLAVRLPDVNESAREHHGVGSRIQLGLRGVGTLREQTIDQVIANRRELGPFRGLGDFIFRVRPMRDEAEALIACGALDELGANRPTMLRNLRAGFEAYREGPGPLAIGADDVFDRLPPAPDWSEQERYAAERRVLGFSPGTHPLALLELPVDGCVLAREMGRHAGRRVTMIGWAYSHKRITTRKNREPMEFIAMEDLTGRFEVTVFPRVYDRHAPILHGNGPFRLRGMIEHNHGVYTLTADWIERIEETVASEREQAREAFQYGSGRRAKRRATRAG